MQIQNANQLKISLFSTVERGILKSSASMMMSQVGTSADNVIDHYVGKSGEEMDEERKQQVDDQSGSHLLKKSYIARRIFIFHR